MDTGVIIEESGIISPPLGCLSFEVDGVVYKRTPTLALGRARIFERMLLELQFGATTKGIVETFMEGYSLLNASKWADGITKFGLLKEKLNLLGANRILQAEIVGLFYNAPGEDSSTYVLADFQEKVYTAWRAVDRDFFISQCYLLLTSTESRYQHRPEQGAPEATP